MALGNLSLRKKGAFSRGFEPGHLYASYAKEQKALDVANCGWEKYECKEKMDIITSFHVFEHLTKPIKAFEKAVSWLKEDGLIYIEVLMNLANSLIFKRGRIFTHGSHIRLWSLQP